jgi:uncharacterized repeat protein (TIGR01451 family)
LAALLAGLSHAAAGQTPTSDLSVTGGIAVSPPAPMAGSPITYTITATLVAGSATTGVTITDVLPGNVAFVSASLPGGTCSENCGTVACSLGTSLGLGGTARVTIQGTTAPSGTAYTLRNLAGVASKTFDPNLANNSAYLDTPVSVGGPTVTGIMPSVVSTVGGTLVTITGTGFVSGATVKLGGTQATGVTVTPTSITAMTPAHPAGTFDVVVTNPDARSGTLTNGVTFSCPTIGLTPTTLSNGTVGVVYSQALNGSGGSLPYAFNVISGTLPLGLGLSATGLISGTPSVGGISTFSVRATDAEGCSGTRSYSLTVVTPGGLSGLTLNPTSVQGGDPSTGTLTFSASVSGAVVSLSSDRTSLATVPATVTVNGTSGTFTVTTYRWAGIPQTVTISASYNGNTVSAPLTITRSRPITVQFRTPVPPAVGGTQTSTGTVDLDVPAPAGGTVVSLSSANPSAAIVPASVTVQQDQTSASFTINTYVVPTTVNVTLTATMGVASASTSLTVRSPAFEGYLDGADCDSINGWAWDSYRPNTPINVDIIADGVAIVYGLPANIYRGDLGRGNNFHGFWYPTPANLHDGHSHSIAVYYSGSVPPTQLGTSPKTITCAPPTVSIAWVLPAEVTWGPAGTLTAAGYAQNGTGGVTLWWRDATIGGPWTFVSFPAVPGADHSWSNSIPSGNSCHVYQVQAVYSGVTSPIFTYDGRALGYCVIQVQSATYGGNCGAPQGNATWSVAPSCNGLASCDYTVDYHVLGDPAPGCAKDFVAQWTCGGDQIVRTVYAPPEAGFGSVVRLSCP